MAEIAIWIAIVYTIVYGITMTFVSLQSWFDYRHKYLKNAKDKSCFEQFKAWGKLIWNKKRMYAPILVHLFDTASDMGVLAEWYILAKLETTSDDPDDNVEGKPSFPMLAVANLGSDVCTFAHFFKYGYRARYVVIICRLPFRDGFISYYFEHSHL